jgi:hypothetical protein
MSSKLATDSRLDVQFSAVAAQSPFGFASFDNAQVRHAVHRDAWLRESRSSRAKLAASRGAARATPR